METMESGLRKCIGQGIVTLIINGKRRGAEVMEICQGETVRLQFKHDCCTDRVVPIASINRVSPAGGV